MTWPPVDEIKITEGYWPGAISQIVALHLAYYEPEWGFGRQFECMVAGDLARFLERYDSKNDLLLCAQGADGTLIGSVTIDGIGARAGPGAHLRWFIVAESARGTGLGKRLLATAVAFCDLQAYEKIYLTTFAGLDAARHLYENAGFTLVSEMPGDAWHGSVGEQRFERLSRIGD